MVVFKDKPFELWDLRAGTMLRQMPKHFPHVTALVCGIYTYLLNSVLFVSVVSRCNLDIIFKANSFHLNSGFFISRKRVICC